MKTCRSLPGLEWVRFNGDGAQRSNLFIDVLERLSDPKDFGIVLDFLLELNYCLAFLLNGCR